MMWKVGGSVLASVYNNKNFTALPVDQPMLQAALTDFTASIAATLQGGSQATNQKNKKKHELVAPPAKARTLRSGQLERGSGDPDVRRLPRCFSGYAFKVLYRRRLLPPWKSSVDYQTNRFERSAYLAANPAACS